MTLDEIKSIVAECSFHEYAFVATIDGRGAMYLQARYSEPDVHTGVMGVQHTRRWFLSPYMSKSEVVQTAFKLVITSMEHRAREWFQYRGRAVFGPHFNVDVLWGACEAQEDKRA